MSQGQNSFLGDDLDYTGHLLKDKRAARLYKKGF